MAVSSPTFGPQWPQRNPNIVTLVRKDGLRIPLHAELVDLVSMLMDPTEAMGYDILPGQTWGYANRPISGTVLPSNHSRGVSVDINAPSNPYASAAWHQRNANSHPFGLPRRSDIPQAVFELWEAHGFYLGVRYASKPDPMHFEFTGTVAEARKITADLQAFLHHPPAALPKPPPIPQESETMYFASAKANSNVWFFEPGRRTLVPTAQDREQIAKASGIPNVVAEIDDGFFKNLAEGRTVHQ